MPESIAIFLGAFLLFFIQPLAGKQVLPSFGGGANAWIVVMVFFQALLLAGYGFAHGLGTLGSRRLQRAAYAALALCCLAALGWSALGRGAPLRLGPAGGSLSPAAILGALVPAFLLPGVLLAASSPLIQSWFHLRHPGGNPYRLYALSNAGSLLGLLVHPFLVEPFLPLPVQAWIGASLIVAYAILMLWLSRHTPPVTLEAAGPAEAAPGTAEAAAWVGLAVLGSVLFSASTNALSEELSSMPLVWVLPLAAYLTSFILAFREGLDLSRWSPQFALVAAGLYAVLPTVARTGNAWVQLATATLLVFLATTAVHSRLSALRPQARFLTRYYLCLAVGGCAGGILVGMVFPFLFSRSLELPLACLLLPIAVHRQRASPPAARRIAEALALGAALLAVAWVSVGEFKKPGRSFRDFFGTLRIVEHPAGTTAMYHGRIVHGLQVDSDPGRALGYHGPGSGSAKVFRDLASRHPALKVGIVGLGAGNFAVHAREGDAFTFFEISPEVIRLAGPKGESFKLLARARGRMDVLEKDGRQGLRAWAEAGRPAFDLLVLDAFSGGNVPWHMMTQEAFGTYLSVLAPDGVIVFNVSNHLPVDLVVLASAKASGLAGLAFWNAPVQDASGQVVLEPPSLHWAFSRSLRPLQGLARGSDAILVPDGTSPLPGPLQAKANLGRRLAQRMPPWRDERNSLVPLLLVSR